MNASQFLKKNELWIQVFQILSRSQEGSTAPFVVNNQEKDAIKKVADDLEEFSLNFEKMLPPFLQMKDANNNPSQKLFKKTANLLRQISQFLE